MSDRQRNKGFCLHTLTYEGRILYPFVSHSYNQQRYIKNLKYPDRAIRSTMGYIPVDVDRLSEFWTLIEIL